MAKSYRIIKDNKRKTGRGRIKFPFFNEMDDILGLRRSNGGADTIGSGINGVVITTAVDRQHNNQKTLDMTRANVIIVAAENEQNVEQNFEQNIEQNIEQNVINEEQVGELDYPADLC